MLFIYITKRNKKPLPCLRKIRNRKGERVRRDTSRKLNPDIAIFYPRWKFVADIAEKKKRKRFWKKKNFSRSIRVKHGRVVFSRITMTRSRTDGVADTVPQAAREVTPGITAITCIQTVWWVDQHKFDHRIWHFETSPIYSLQCHWKIWSHSRVREFADMQHIIPLT